MAHAITSAKAVAITPQANAAAAGSAAGGNAQASDNSVFSQLLAQMQPMQTASDGSQQPLLDSLLADGKSGAAADKLLLSSQLSADGTGTVDAASLAQMLQALMVGTQQASTEASDAGRQQLPVAAGIAAKVLRPQLQQADMRAADPSPSDTDFSKLLAAADAALPATTPATAAPQPATAPGLEQVLARLGEAMQAGSAASAQNAAAAPSTLAAAKGKNVLPGDVRLMFRAEGRAEQDNSQPVVDGKLLADQAGALAAGSAAQQTQPEQGMQEISQPMTQGSNAWRQAFADKLSNMVQLKLDSASIKVTPDHLGPLDISISFDSQNKAQISVIAANHAARDIVASGLPQLGKMLEQSGIQVGNVEVSSQQQQFARQQDPQWQHGQHQGRQRQQERDEYSSQADDALAGAAALDAVASSASSTDQLSIRA